MATARQTQFLEVTGLTSGRNAEIGAKGVFATFVPTNGETQMFSATVADGGTQQLMWLTTEGGMATFEHVVIVADKDITIEFSDGAESYTVSLKAGMFYSGGGQMFVDQAASSVDTMGDIDQIMVKRNVADGVGDAFVQMLLIG
jgi:hypothetical protein